MKPLIQAPPVQSAISWWLTAKREDFTATVVKEQQARMKVSTFGRADSKPYNGQENREQRRGLLALRGLNGSWTSR